MIIFYLISHVIMNPNDDYPYACVSSEMLDLNQLRTWFFNPTSFDCKMTQKQHKYIIVFYPGPNDSFITVYS